MAESETRSYAPENQSSSGESDSHLLPSCVVWPPQIPHNAAAPLALLLLSIVSASKRRGCGEVRAEGGRVKLCHRSAEVLVRIDRTGRDRREGASLDDHHHIYALKSFLSSCKLPSMLLISITHRSLRFMKRSLKRTFSTDVRLR